MSADLSLVLKAGGMVPAGARLAKDEVVDTVVARGYRHPVLPGRTVVRLTAEAVAAGDDLEMTVLGFAVGEDRGAVGKERRRPLGFPGWALVHDPKNARYALDVVGELKKHARKAKSKPGHAKEGIDALAAQLGKTVPHFLPSFFEEAGRAFIEHGAHSFAATMFAKAREAEAVHALEIDEQHRVDAFLEFALAGAVTTKALAEYAKDLAKHHEPKAAYAHFRQLCVQRTLGGMPPWAGMAKDLRRLAKAAKLDADEEDARIVEEIVQSPALAKAAGELWRSYRAAIVALGKKSASVRGTLLNLFPTGGGEDLDEIWLDLIEESGAVEALVGNGASEDARPTGGRAAWFDRLCQHLARDWHKPWVGVRAFALLRRMAPTLAADGHPIACRARWHALDLDLAELALELALVVEPPPNARLDLNVWAKNIGDPERGRDPVRCAAHDKVGVVLAEAVANAIGNDVFDGASRGKAGFLAAKRRWLETLLGRAESSGVPALADTLGEIAKKVKPETFAELRDLHARFAALDVAPVLSRSLRIGLIDEFGWPALEDAAAELNPDGKAELTIHGGLPALVVANATRAIAVGPARRLGVHDLVIPAKHALASIRFIGGQFLVALKEGWKLRVYWSGAPRDVFDIEGNAWHIPTVAPRACVLPDGAWLEGKRAIRVGDRTWPEIGLAACDGTTAWIYESKDGRQVMREVSASGEPGRSSWPAFVEGAVEEGWQIDAPGSYVLPCPEGISTSPLGNKDGMVGVRARVRGQPPKTWTARELVRIDGRTYAGPVDARVRDLLSLPGGELRPVFEETAWRQGTTASILDEAGKMAGCRIAPGDQRYWRGSVAALPPAFWHALVPRDAVGSRRLRGVTDADARGLIGALAGKSFDELANEVPVAAIERALPEVTHPRLRRGIAGLVALGAQLQVWRDKLRDERAPGKTSTRASVASGPDDDAIKAALSGWVDLNYGNGSAVAQIGRVGAWFGSSDHGDRTELVEAPSPVAWQPLALFHGVLAFLARAVGVSAEQRRTLESLHATLSAALPDMPKLRVWYGSRTPSAAPEDTVAKAHFVLRWHGGNAYAIARQGWNDKQVRVLEYAPAGQWKPLPEFNITTTLRSAAALANLDGPPLSLDGADRLAELTGMTRSEAVYLLAGCPNMASREANFLPKELREMLGLKAAQAQIAHDALRLVPQVKKLVAIEVAMQTGGTIDALAAAWVKYVGKRVTIPEELIAEADRAVQAPIGQSVALAMIGAGEEAPELTKDHYWGLHAQGQVIVVGAPEPLVGQIQISGQPGFDARVLQTACMYLPFLFAALPVGHPLRSQARKAYDLVLARLASPSLILDCGELMIDEGQRAAIDGLVASLGGEEIHGLVAQMRGRSVPGALILRTEWAFGAPPVTSVRLGVKIRPAMLDAKTGAMIGKLVASSHHGIWRYLQLFRGADLAAMMKRIDETPVPAGGWEQNPLASVPDLVDRAAKKFAVSRDAAGLYLQYLVLLWPTPKNLQLWNGWRPKQFEAANAELAGKELVLEAKRERAQRGYFLPGGWEALKSPRPPMETWKVPFYGTRTGESHVAPAAGSTFLALAPFHLLFERAWKRVESGDVPRYEDVKR